MTTITTEQAKLFVDAAGEGTPVVLVHGSWSDHTGWDALVPELPGGMRVVRYDRRGHSRSECPPGPGNLEQDVDDLAAVIETFAGGRAHVVGNSLGATIALRLGCRRPELVRTLALHEPPLWGIAAGDPVVDGTATAMEPVLERLAAGDREGGARAFSDRVLGPDAWETAMPAAFKRLIIANAPTFLDEAGDPGAYAFDLRRAEALAVPVLLSAGEDGDEAFAIVADRLAVALPDVERATLAGAHIPQRTHPAAFAAALADFWERHT